MRRTNPSNTGDRKPQTVTRACHPWLNPLPWWHIGSRALRPPGREDDAGQRAHRHRRPYRPGPPMISAMHLKIDLDVKRFKQSVRGVIKKEFRKYLTQGELIGKQGKHLVSIPLPQIEIPRFRFGSKEAGGVGQGEGEAGDPMEGAPGTAPGEHILEAEVDPDELAGTRGAGP